MTGNRERYIKIGTKLLTPHWWQLEDIFSFSLYISFDPLQWTSMTLKNFKVFNDTLKRERTWADKGWVFLTAHYEYIRIETVFLATGSYLHNWNS